VERRARNGTASDFYPIPPDEELAVEVVTQCCQSKINVCAYS